MLHFFSTWADVKTILSMIQSIGGRPTVLQQTGHCYDSSMYLLWYRNITALQDARTWYNVLYAVLYCELHSTLQQSGTSLHYSIVLVKVRTTYMQAYMILIHGKPYAIAIIDVSNICTQAQIIATYNIKYHTIYSNSMT